MFDIDRLRDMLGDVALDVPGDTLASALAESLTWDEAGRAPGEPGYLDTYDLYWAAATWLEEEALRRSLTTGPALKQVTSEGTTMTFDGATADWRSIAAAFRAKSPLWRAMQGTGIGHIDVDRGPHYTPTSAGLQGWV